MEPLSTSTQILLINQKLDLLEHYFDWTIGGVTISLTFLIALFLAVQFGSYKKLLDSKTAKLLTQLNKSRDDIEEKMHKMQAQAASSNGRSMAMTCLNKKDYSGAFLWTVWAAFWYYSGSLAGRDKQVEKYLQSAKNSLSKATAAIYDKSHKETLDSALNTLREDFPNLVSEIEIMLKDKYQEKSK